MEAWRGISPSDLAKEGQWRRKCLFITGVGAGKFWECEGFLPEFPQTCPKNFLGNFCPLIFSHNDHEDLFWCDLQKKVFMCFSVKLGCHCLMSNNIGRYFYPDFQGFCSDFQRISKTGGALAPPPPTPLLFITVS